MVIGEALKKISELDNSDRLPKYVEIEDISDFQVKKEGNWQEIPYIWGVFHNGSDFVYFETDEKSGLVSIKKSFENENDACSYAVDSMRIIGLSYSPDSPLFAAIDHIKEKYGYTEKVAKKMACRMFRYTNVFEEFLNCTRTGMLCGEDGTKVEILGYNAEKLKNDSDLSPLGAYNYLVYLLEKPEEALENIKKGMKRK